jgi:hypothetical protein
MAPFRSGSAATVGLRIFGATSDCIFIISGEVDRLYFALMASHADSKLLMVDGIVGQMAD